MKTQANGFPREHTNIPDPPCENQLFWHAYAKAYKWRAIFRKYGWLPQQDPRKGPERR